MKELKEYIRSIPDFPEKGIIFRDVTSVLQDADALKLSIDELAKRLEGVDFDRRSRIQRLYLWSTTCLCHA